MPYSMDHLARQVGRPFQVLLGTGCGSAGTILSARSAPAPAMVINSASKRRTVSGWQGSRILVGSGAIRIAAGHSPGDMIDILRTLVGLVRLGGSQHARFV